MPSLQPLDFAGQWVLVTGSSSGLGKEFARQLAYEHRAHLILVARRRGLLEELRQELVTKAGIQVEIIEADLADPQAVERVLRQCTLERPVYAALLNAGITHFGQHDELKWEELQRMIQINVSSVVRLASGICAQLEATKTSGGIFLISSIAGLIPVPYQTAYSGTKSFIVAYGSALASELRRKGISVTVYAPGGIRTEMTATSRFKPLEKWLMPVDRAARLGLAAFRRRAHVCVPGLSNQLLIFMSRLLPRRFLASRTAALYWRALQASAPERAGN